MVGSVWPYLEKQYNRHSVDSPGKMIGSQLGWVETADAFSQSGKPTLVFGDAFSEFIPYFKSHDLPWLVVVNKPSRTGLPLESQVRMENNGLFTHANFQLDNYWCWLVYSITQPIDRFGDPIETATPKEYLWINGQEFSLANGRVIELDLVDGEFDISQHKVKRIPAEEFRTAYLDDKARIRKSLRWWQAKKRRLIR